MPAPITITSASQLRSLMDSESCIVLPARLNQSLPLTRRLPAFETMSQVRCVASRIAWNLTTWAEIADAVVARAR